MMTSGFRWPFAMWSPLLGLSIVVPPVFAERGTVSQDAHAAPASIGVATQEPDGTIILNLRASGDGGATGDAQFRYAPTDRDYSMIAKHVGPIPRGGSVPVKPFDKK